MNNIKDTWCIKDEHHLYEQFTDFNEWLDSENGYEVQKVNNIEGLSQPSKAFYSSDKEAYRQAYKEYRKDRRHEVLGEIHLTELCSDRHWFQRNLDHFFQLVTCLEKDSVVPFIGAGLSVEGGFPTWKEHLINQGRTAGLDNFHVEDLLNSGKYELIIEEIENKVGKPVFIQEIRDAFLKTGSLTNTILLVSELFKDTVITTNYDNLIEQAYDIGEENNVNVIKLHGDIANPIKCILSKNQYDEAYGVNELNISLPIPKKLLHQYRENSLLFLGCSLNNDRTVEVFKKIKDDSGDTDLPQHFSLEQTLNSEEELASRNAYLASIGITPIWFEQEQFEYVEYILELAINELRYKKSKTVKPKLPSTEEAIKGQETPFQSVNDINWIRKNWKGLNRFTKVLITGFILIVLFTSIPSVYTNYKANKEVFKEVVKSSPNDDIKQEMDYVFYSGILFNGYLYELPKMNTGNIINSSNNELLKCFSTLGFKENKLLSYKNISNNFQQNLKAYYEVRSQFEGFILKKDKRYKHLFYSGYYLSDILRRREKSALRNFLKEWRKYKKLYKFKLPEIPLNGKIKDKNDLLKKAVETSNILRKYFS